MDKKQILLTYDYELFLGEDSGDLYKTLINPADKILRMLKKYNAKGLFFIDASFLFKIKDNECFTVVKKQIRNIIQDGHDIGLHIHPHWNNAELIDECRWIFKDYKHFRLHSYDDKTIEKIIKETYELLSEVVYEVDNNYKIDTFRAGGWCIQPFDKLAIIFKEIGIKYDFSVLPDMKDDDMPKHYYDYTKVPKGKYTWYFEKDVLKENKHGNFIEISNTVFNMNIIDLMKNRKLLKNYNISGDGKGAGKKKSFYEQLKRVRWNVKQILSSDSIDINLFKKYINKIDRDVIVYVAHPKLFSENSFGVLEYICCNFKTIKYKEIKV